LILGPVLFNSSIHYLDVGRAYTLCKITVVAKLGGVDDISEMCNNSEQLRQVREVD